MQLAKIKMSLKYKPIISSLEERQTYNVKLNSTRYGVYHLLNGVISGGFIVSQIYPFYSQTALQ